MTAPVSARAITVVGTMGGSWSTRPYAIQRPSGDQTGAVAPSRPPVANFRASVPSMLIVQIAHEPSRLLAKASRWPSGDQLGERSSARLCVSCRIPLPSAFMT
jgi:hypothetical protein